MTEREAEKNPAKTQRDPGFPTAKQNKKVSVQ